MATQRYMDVVTDIKEAIANGTLKPGDKISSENELSAKYGLSRQTIRHAIYVLEEDGLLRRVRGSGTYVADNAIADRSDCKTIAIITTYVDSYIFPKMIHCLGSVLSEAGYTVQICFTNNTLSREREILESIIAKDEVAGIIVEPTKSHLPNPNLKYYEELKRMHVPMLFLNSYYEGINIPHVSINDTQAGYMAAKHLLTMGHKNIGGVFKLDDGQGARRYYGFIKALREAQITLSAEDIIWFDTVDMMTRDNVESLYQRVRQRLKNCSALLFYNDETAIRLLECFRRDGVRIPEDLSVVGIDDSVLSPDENNKLTSVIFPTEEIARKAAYNMLELIRNPKFFATYEFDLEMAVRDSVRQPSSQILL